MRRFPLHPVRQRGGMAASTQNRLALYARLPKHTGQEGVVVGNALQRFAVREKNRPSCRRVATQIVFRFSLMENAAALGPGQRRGDRIGGYPPGAGKGPSTSYFRARCSFPLAGSDSRCIYRRPGCACRRTAKRGHPTAIPVLCVAASVHLPPLINRAAASQPDRPRLDSCRFRRRADAACVKAVRVAPGFVSPRG